MLDTTGSCCREQQAALPHLDILYSHAFLLSLHTLTHTLMFNSTKMPYDITVLWLSDL